MRSARKLDVACRLDLTGNHVVIRRFVAIC